MTDAPQTSVHASVVVDAPIDEAFRIFTEDMASWWPPEHHLLEGPLDAMIVEPRVGGRIYDRGTDGQECQWARVVGFDPPHRFAFSWDINLQWAVEADPAKASEVEVHFVADGPGRTQVLLEHRHLDRHGDGWEGMRAAVGGPDGWPAGLGAYAARVARPPAEGSKGFVFKLIPPRPDFPFTMTDAERAVMQDHVGYWTGLVHGGQAVAFGPVADPAGPYGIGIIFTTDGASAEALRDGDPAIRSDRGFRTEISPMLSLVTAAGRFDA